MLALPWFVTIVSATPIQADLHLDTPTQLHRKHVGFDSDTGLEGGLPQLRAGGTNLAVEVLWPPRNVDHEAHVFVLLEQLEAEIQRIEALTLVRTPDMARAAADQNKIGILVSLEGTHGLGTENWEKNLDNLHARGVGMIGLTWSFSNSFAGSSGDQGGGLTETGNRLVSALWEKGLIIDLSHASRATTLEVCGASPVPVLASHSNAHAVNAHTRNLTDEEIRCIAKTGGVIGMNFHKPFVGGSGGIQALADHADHIAGVGGHASVALGSDFDGLIRPVAGLEDASRLNALWTELRSRGWSEQQILGIRGENFLRAWSRVLSHSTSHGDGAAL